MPASMADGKPCRSSLAVCREHRDRPPEPRLDKDSRLPQDA